MKRFAPLASAVALLAAPAASQAADTYIDDDSGSNLNACTLAQPCATVQKGVDTAGANDTVRVDGGSYAESVTLDGGKSVIAEEFVGDLETSTVIDGTAAGAITVPVLETAGSIRSLTLRSTTTALELGGPATVIGNTFDSTADGSTGVSIATLAAGSSTIGPVNSFTDDGVDSEVRSGVTVVNGAAPTITGNTFSALSRAIVGSANSTISDNEITGTHTVMGGFGVAIGVSGNATIVANHIHSPDPDTGHVGVSVNPGTSATLRRNRIFGHGFGVYVQDTSALVTLNSDVIKGSSAGGLQSVDTIPIGPGEGDVSATNVTFTGNGPDIYLDDTVLTLNSSIVEDAIQVTDAASCVISFSAGPTMTPGGNGCANFQATAAPMLAPDGYHLLPGSPMIDMGDPAAPIAPTDFAVDGQPRAIDADGACPLDRVRDIGADEFAATEPFCPAATTPTLPTLVPPVAGKNPQCAVLRAKLKKAKSKSKKRKIRRQLRQLGC